LSSLEAAKLAAFILQQGEGDQQLFAQYLFVQKLTWPLAA
jgi:hypothetical protein